jgi:predicted  nucleic acid-binding Zn-ribbon protein
METQTEFIAALAIVDYKLDELKEDFGDLPEQLRKRKDAFDAAKKLVDETSAILEEIRKFVSSAKVTLVDLKDKEEKLTKQQFNVRNNKEFDAITSEIAHLKLEHEKLSSQMRGEGMKEENLKNILANQQEQMEKTQKALADKEEEVKYLTTEQTEEQSKLDKTRKKLIKKIDKDYFEEYERIRTMHSDAAVKIKRNSCSGCFSAIPAQLIVEVRNNPDKAYYCENCGRMLLPEDIEVAEEDVAKFK